MHNCQWVSRPRPHDAKHDSGRVAIYIKYDLTKGTVVEKQGPDDVIWLRLCK